MHKKNDFSSVTIHAKAHKHLRQSFALHGYSNIQLPIKQYNLLVDLPHFQLVVSNFCTQVPLVQHPHILVDQAVVQQECIDVVQIPLTRSELDRSIS